MTWKDSFRKQTDNGQYWKNLYKEDFDKQRFLERGDAENICKKAQEDAYENVIKTLQGKVDESIITEIKQLIVDLCEEDTSALGVTYKGKTY
jgi:phosphoribosyl-ATP pyrophosphohydrolase